MLVPDGFVWGVATAAYQVEGAAHKDGRGLSVWDMFCRQPGKVTAGHSGDVGCDHYHRYEEDCRIMAEIGVTAYRLSISWPRVLPDGTGAVNRKGLAFYDRLVDTLLQHGIEPWVTLFHWDYPYALYARGGWLNRDSAHWFADYTRVIAETLSDRVACRDYGKRNGRHGLGTRRRTGTRSAADRLSVPVSPRVFQKRRGRR